MKDLAGVSNPWPMGSLWLGMAMNVAQHKIINLLKTFFFCSSVFTSVCVFHVCPKTTLHFPVWPRDTKRLDTPSYTVLIPVHVARRGKTKILQDICSCKEVFFLLFIRLWSYLMLAVFSLLVNKLKFGYSFGLCYVYFNLQLNITEL